MTQEILARKLGIGKSALSMIETGRASLSERNKNAIIQQLNVNPEWLETGQGPMFFDLPHETDPTSRAMGNPSMHRVPLYSLDGTVGLATLLLDRESVSPVDYLYIPNLPHCDGAVYVVGDSMSPLLKSGDIVLYKQVRGIDSVFWGDMYLLSIDFDGEEYITVKYLQKSEKEGCVKLVSQNPYHADKDVPVEQIRAWAFVKASIRINSIR